MNFIAMKAAFDRRWVGTLAYAAIAIAGTAGAFFAINSQFSPWDDEGYLVSSIAEFLRGGSLYDEIYTQYGPFYYLLFGGLSKVTGIAPTHDAGRIISTLIWSATALVIGLTAERAAASRAVGLIATVAAFSVPFVVKEPMHPVGICTLLVVGTIAIVTWGRGIYWRGGAVAAGATVGALALIKINMGALAALGLVAAALLAAAPVRRTRSAAVLAALLLTAAPAVLMSKDLDHHWAQKGLILTLGALAAILVRAWPESRDADAPPLTRLLTWFAAGALAVVLATCAVIVVTGTSVADIVDGVLVDPTRHPGIDFIAFPLPGAVVFCAIVAVAAAAAARTRTRWRPGDDLVARGLARIVAAAAIALAVADTAFLGEDTIVVAVPVLLAWIAAQAPGEVDGRPLARLALVLIATLEFLQSYPVAGSQLLGAELPLLLPAAVIAGDGLKLLRLAAESGRERTSRAWIAAGAIAATTATILLVWGMADPGRKALGTYRANQQTSLHGMALTRLPPNEAAGYERIVAALRRCDTFITYPGLSSFYLWTEEPSPTRFNVANWMLLVGDERQQQALDRIMAARGLCVLRNDALAQIRLVASRPRQSGPLVAYLGAPGWRDIEVAAANPFGQYRVQVRDR